MKKMIGVGLCVCIVFGSLFSGCGKRRDWNENSHPTITILGADFELLGVSSSGIDPNYADALYYDSYHKGFNSETHAHPDLGGETACSKRKAALDLSREIWTYSFKSYVALDGVSGLIYNVGYLCSVPHKIVRGLFCMDGVICYIGALVKLGIGSVCAAVGIVAAPIVGTLFHPLETLSNLTIGLLCIDIDGEYSLGLTYTKYVFNTNIIASLIDLVWGAIIYPLLQTILFWL